METLDPERRAARQQARAARQQQARAGEQPQAVQPQAVQPQAVQPQAVQPQAVQPQTRAELFAELFNAETPPQAVQPQAVQPQAVQPQAVQQQARADLSDTETPGAHTCVICISEKSNVNIYCCAGSSRCHNHICFDCVDSIPRETDGYVTCMVCREQLIILPSVVPASLRTE